MKGALLNHTTQVDAFKSAQEIMGYLVAHGISRMQSEYKEGKIIGLVFGMTIGDREIGYRLPVNIEPVYLKMVEHRRKGLIPPRYVTQEQAERVGWRIMKDWVEAQIALIETGMVKLEEVFLPYMLMDSGETVYKMIAERYLALPEPQGPTREDTL